MVAKRKIQKPKANKGGAPSKSEQVADHTAERQANALAIKGFPRAEIKKSLDTMAEAATTEDRSKGAKTNAALDMLKSVRKYADAAEATGVSSELVLQDFDERMAILRKELATAGHKFAVLNKPKGDNPATANWTGYAKNVVSIARGVIAEDVEIGEKDSYVAIRKKVEKARADSAKPEVRAFREAIDKLRAQFTGALNIVRKGGHVKDCEILTVALAEAIKLTTAGKQPEASPEKVAEAIEEAADLPVAVNQ